MAEGSGRPYTTTTYSRGIYALVNMTPDTAYSVTLEKEGYCLQSIGTDGGLIFSSLKMMVNTLPLEEGTSTSVT